MIAPSTIYIGEPDIPAGMTIAKFRRSRPRRVAWWRRTVAVAVQASSSYSNQAERLAPVRS